MQNIDVRFNATSNFGKVKADLAALQAQAAALSGVLQQGAYAKPPAIVDPQSWRVATRAVHEASRVYRDAASSSGLMTTQQIRATSEAERYTKALQKQKLTFQEMMRHRGIMREVYRDQLRYQRMSAQYWGTDMAGRAITDIAIPKNVPMELDSMRRKMGMFGNMAASAGTQVINLGKNIQWAGRQLTVGFTYPAVLFGAAAGMMAFKVEDAFAKINKVYDVSAKALNNEALRSKELGDLRVRSMEMATEVAQKYGLQIQKTLAVEQALAATGLKGEKLLSSTKEVQRISALGDIDPGQTTDMVVALQNAFKTTIKDADDLERVLNFMNATSNATSLSLQDIAEGTPRAASGLAQLGVTAEEMTIMLVSMKEAGVDAAEGANALKSATTRILNPVKKAKDIYSQYGISLEAISKQSGGNLFEFLKILGKEQMKISGQTKKETQRLRAQGIAALFGTYQYNRLNAALVNIGEAYSGANGVNNQTEKAAQLQAKSAAELEKIAKVSEEAMMKNPAGRFKQAWADFQIQLSDMGEPFLEIATKILEVGTAFGKFFNGMDDWKKTAAMWTLIIVGAAGPLIMLSGLFMNLFGQFIKGTGSMLKFLGISKLVTKEEQAAILTAEAQNKAMQVQQKTTSTLAQEIQVLTAAYEKATIAARQFAQTQGVSSAASATTAAAARAQTWRPATPQQSFLGMPGGSASSLFVAPAQQTAKAYDQAAHRAQMLARTERERLNDQTRNSRQALAEQRIREKIQSNITGASLGMAAMSASMGMMMLTNNEFVNSLGKWLLIGTLVVPAVKTLGVATGTAAKAAWSMAAAQMAAARAANAGALGMTRTAGAMGVMRAGLGGLASGIAGVLGPGGMLTLGVLAVGGAYYWAWNKGKEARQEAEAAYQRQKQMAESIESSTRRWATDMGRVVGQYEKVYDVSVAIAGGGPNAVSKQEELINYYKTTPEGGKEAPIDPFKNMDRTSAEFANRMLQKFIDLQVEGRMSAKQAGDHIRAMYIAMGESADTASFEARKFIDIWGSVNKGTFDWSGLLATQMSEFKNASGPEMSTAGKNAAEVFWAGMANAKNPMAAQGLVDQFVSSSQQSIEQTWTEIGSKWGTQWYDFMADQGVTNVQQFAEFMRSHTMDEMRGMDWSKESNSLGRGGYSLPYGQILDILEGANAEQDILLSGLDKIVHFGPDVASVFDLPDYYRVQALTQSYAEQKKVVEDMAAMQGPYVANLDAEAAAQQMNVVNAFNYANGLKLGATYGEAIFNFMNKVPAVTGDAADNAGKLKKNLDALPSSMTISIKANQFGDVYKSAMESVQSDMAESAMNKFNSGWDATMSNVEARHDQAQTAMENRQERAMEAFDARWERRKEMVEAAYQKRIDAVNREIDAERKADETRARLFEKEKARLQALADMANTNIDFNTAMAEGRLDDAAKIMNNAGAGADSAQMDAEQKAAELRSQTRIEALEKKNERLEKQRDKEIKQLEKMEARMRKHLERIQNARSAALQKQQADQMASLEKQRDYEEAILEQRLELFKSYTARNQKDLERWMKKVGLSYDDFGSDVKAKGEEWSTYFQKSLSNHIRKAGMEVANDNSWEKVGKQIRDKLLRGLGFKDMAEFNRFIRTGEKGTAKNGDSETRHDGGIVGSGGGSRGSIPNSYKGLHRTEKMIRAQKGEYVINRKSSAQHKDLLDAINSGTDMGGIMGGAGYGGPVGFLAGAMTHMFARGLGQAFTNAYVKGSSKSPGKFSGTAGEYAGMKWSAEQVKNAAIIASVGSEMGMSSRDLQIGIMTAITESMLRNINFGDRDSVGLFQQRTSQGWGTVEQIMNPRYAAGKFFSALKGVENRGDMSPWMAAQTVQRSFDPTGGNYAKYWDAARSIFSKGLSKTNVGYVPGKGGKHRPINAAVTSGLHGGNSAGNPPAFDFAVPVGRPVYAISDGVITQSKDIAGPLSTDRYRGDGPYGSFGRMIQMQTDSGASALYAHLSRRSVAAGQRVKGGSVIGYTGNTGNSSGPHLHFGATNGPSAWLRRGGKIRYDNTPVTAHRGETMLSERLTKKFEQNVAGGGASQYTVTIDLRGAYIKEDVDIKGAVKEAIHEMENKVGRKRIVK